MIGVATVFLLGIAVWGGGLGFQLGVSRLLDVWVTWQELIPRYCSSLELRLRLTGTGPTRRLPGLSFFTCRTTSWTRLSKAWPVSLPSSCVASIRHELTLM